MLQVPVEINVEANVDFRTVWLNWRWANVTAAVNALRADYRGVRVMVHASYTLLPHCTSPGD